MSPDDLDDPEGRLGDLLAAFDEALADGRGPPGQAGPAPPDLAARLGRAGAALRWIDRQRRKTAPGTTSLPPDYSEAITLPFRPVTGEGRLGRFRLVRELGRGACGVVYLAHDPVLGREVA